MRAVSATVFVPAVPTRALAALLDLDDLQAWWGVDRALVEPRKGGLYVLTWGVTGHGFKYVTTGIVGRYLPGRLLRIDHYTYLNPDRPILGPMRLTVKAQDGNGGTRLDLVQDGYRDGADWDWYHDSVRAAWPTALQALQTHLTRVA